MHRLEAQYPDLYARLQRAAPQQMRSAARAAARTALAIVEVEDAAGMTPDAMPDRRLAAKAEAIARHLDRAAWDRQEAGDAETYGLLFSKARAASALAYALDPRTEIVAAEAVYEAAHALDDPGPAIRAAEAALLE